MSEVNEMVQEVATAGVSRRHFVQGAAAVAAGAALPMTQILGGSSVSAAKAKVLRIATQEQEGPASPWTTKGGSLIILGSVGEWLVDLDAKGGLVPRIAKSWTASTDAKTWTFKIRTDVKFHDGSALTADDVVATFQAHLDDKNQSKSKGVLGACTSAGIKKIDATTIKFELTRADANFPYVVSKASYGLMILKKGTNGGAPWIKKMIGAGPWIMVSHKLNEKTVFKKNPNYYDKARIPKWDTMEQIQYVSAATAVPALKTGKIDAIGLILAKDATAVGTTDFYQFRIPTTGGLHMHMRCDAGPFTDKRVREALALSIDRQAFIDGVLGGAAEVANDSVMDSFKATRDAAVPQRKKDLAAAKALMVAAGVPNGFKVDLNTWKRDDNDKFAQYVKTSAKEIGIDITLKIDGSDGGATVFYTYKPEAAIKGKIFENNGSWLACELGIAEWGGRATPDPYLNREWRSDGDWNASHVNDKDIDAGVDLWNAATTLELKKAASSAIQKASLAATPYIIAYNETRISVVSNKVKNLEFNSLGMIEAGKATPA